MRTLVLVVGAVLAIVAGQAGAIDLKEGQNYMVYRPAQPTESKDRIEVTEFFWYGCSHCFELEPLLQTWLKKLPKDAAFRRVPAVFPGRDGTPGPWAPAAKLYYTLEAMGLLDKLHEQVFNAVQTDRIRLINDDATLFAWIGKKGVDASKFADTYNSFAVLSKVRRAMQLSAAYGLDGVPALIVDGRYRAENGVGGGYEVTLAVVDKLIDLSRKDHPVRK